MFEESDIENRLSIADIGYDYSNSKELEKYSDATALVAVLSIDGGSKLNLTTKERVRAYTYGTFRVEKVLRGNLKEGEEKEFIRGGGIISASDYMAGLYPAELEKFLSLSKGNTKGYVKRKFAEDIDIEAGKTYLVYLLSPEREHIQGRGLSNRGMARRTS